MEGVTQLEELYKKLNDKIYSTMGIPKHILNDTTSIDNYITVMCVLGHIQKKLYEANANLHEELVLSTNEETSLIIQGKILALDGFCGYVERLMEEYKQ